MPILANPQMSFEKSDMDLIMKELEDECSQTIKSKQCLEITRTMMESMIGSRKVPHPSSWGFYNDTTIEIIVSDVRYCSIMINTGDDPVEYSVFGKGEKVEFEKLTEMLIYIYQFY